MTKTLVLIGGTGGLGSQVAKGLVTAEGYDTKKALVRNPDSEKAYDLKSLGWELVAFEDYSNAHALEQALENAHTIVSTLSGGDMVTLEKAIVDAAKANGSSLFVPSQFGVDYRRWGTSFPFLAGKKMVFDYAKEQGVPTLVVFNGLFSDWIFDFLASPSEGKARMVGDGSGKVTFTRRSDIGYVLAKSLSNEPLDALSNSTLSMQGTTLPYKEALDLLSEALGKPLTLEVISVEDAAADEAKLLDKGLQGDMGAFFGAFALHLLGEPQRGNTGCDTSAEAKSYGFKLELLTETLKSVYGAK